MSTGSQFHALQTLFFRYDAAKYYLQQSHHLMVKVVITDFDGVVRHWDNRATRKVEEDCKLPAGTLSAICFSKDLLHPAINGQVTKEQWFENAHAKLKAQYGQGVADHYIQAWHANAFSIDTELLACYREYFPEAKLALATNATSGLHGELRAAKLEHSFDFVFNSSAMGVAKPKKQFFYAMLISMGVKPAEALFIDDSLTNVMAAKELGISSLHFDNRSKVMESLTHHALQASLVV
jgi:putative hydrolase of the HAD superfamily